MSLFDKIATKRGLTGTKLKVARNLFWAVTGKVVVTLASLLVGIAVARYLGPESYGLMNYIISYVLLFQVIAEFGLTGIEVREEAKEATDRDKIMGTAFVLRCAFALITMVLVVVTTLCFETDAYTKGMIAVYSLTILLNSFIVIRNHFTSLVWNEYVVKNEIGCVMIGMVIKIILIVLHASLTWFILALLVDALLLASGYILSYQAKIDSMRKWYFDKEQAKELIQQAFPLLLSGAAVIVYQKIDQVMIGQMLTKEDVGQFSVAAKFVEVLVFIPTMIAQTISPILVQVREKDPQEYEQKAQLFMNITLWTCIIFAALLSLCAYPIIRFTFGEAYLPAVAVLQVFSFKAVSVALSSTAGQMIVIERLQKYAIVRDLFGCAVCVLLNYILLPHLGIKAAAIVAILSNFAAGYIADLFVPQYWHLFRRQSKALAWGWMDLIHIKQLMR